MGSACSAQASRDDEHLVMISFKLSQQLLDEIDRMARIYRTSRSAIIRKALERYLQAERPYVGHYLKVY